MTKDNPVAAGVAELLPCPFCGCSDIEIIGRSIDCRACHAGFYVDKDESPVAAWNRRAALFLELDGSIEADAICRQIDATLSRLKPGEKGGA